MLHPSKDLYTQFNICQKVCKMLEIQQWIYLDAPSLVGMKVKGRDLPGDSVVDSAHPLWEAWVPFLVEKLRSHKPCGTAKSKNKQKKPRAQMIT